MAYDAKKTSKPSKTSEKLHVRSKEVGEEEEEDPTYSPYSQDYELTEVK